MDKEVLKGNVGMMQAYFNCIKDNKRISNNKKNEIALAIQLGKAQLSKGKKRREEQLQKPKRCMMCGKPTTNKSGFCNEYVGTSFGCKEQWKEEYSTMPTKKELNASWRNI